MPLSRPGRERAKVIIKPAVTVNEVSIQLVLTNQAIAGMPDKLRKPPMLFGTIGVDECLLFTTPYPSLRLKYGVKGVRSDQSPESSDTVSEEGISRSCYRQNCL